MTKRDVDVVGCGVLGLWQALTLARRGNRVRLIEENESAFANSASLLAGVMLGPDFEAEAAPEIVREAGHAGLEHWRAVYPGVIQAGTLAVAMPRDRVELDLIARRTRGHVALDREALAALEPDLAGHHARALHFAHEAHMSAGEAMAFLLTEVRRAGAAVELGKRWSGAGGPGRIVIDCRGIAARDALPDLRGVRGERIVVRSEDVRLARPVRLIHPRHATYIVPWADGRFMIGATLIESEDRGPITVRSALELLGTAVAVHPAFGEAEIVETGAGIRPAFADNVPRAVVREGGRLVHVNGAYRHGFLLAPALALAVADFLEGGALSPLLVHE